MYNLDLIGKNIDDAIAMLKDASVEKINIIHNDTKGEFASDIELVVKADVTNDLATLVVSKFRLKI